MGTCADCAFCVTARKLILPRMNFFTMSSAEHLYSPCTEEAFFDKRGERFGIYADTALKHPEPINVYLMTIGRKWMDFLTPRLSQSPLLCSERVLNGMLSANLTGFRALLTRLHPPGKKAISPPWNYYWIIPTGLPYQFSKKLYRGSQKIHQYKFVFESADLDECRRQSLASKEFLYSKRIPIEETWDGKDFNRLTKEDPVGSAGYTLCSRRVLDLAARDKWTNIQFAPFDRVDPFPIDHLNGPWPPKSFYSKYEPQ
jgi:hypothetical protein